MTAPDTSTAAVAEIMPFLRTAVYASHEGLVRLCGNTADILATLAAEQDQLQADLAARDHHIAVMEEAFAKMQAERGAAIARAEALQEHVTELLSGQACACGYDSPYDVCLGHLPLYRKTVARAEAAEARVAELEALLDRDLADALKGRPATVALGIHPGGDELNYYRSRANSLQIAMDRQIRIADDYRKEGVAYRRKSESAADQAAIREVKLREKLAASQDRVSELEGALHLTSDQALTAEIPEGYGPDQRAEWGAGYDAAIANSRAALAQPTDQAEVTP
jgi:hypothetical protein